MNGNLEPKSNKTRLDIRKDERNTVCSLSNGAEFAGPSNRARAWLSWARRRHYHPCLRTNQSIHPSFPPTSPCRRNDGNKRRPGVAATIGLRKWTWKIHADIVSPLSETGDSGQPKSWSRLFHPMIKSWRRGESPKINHLVRPHKTERLDVDFARRGPSITVFSRYQRLE